MQVKTPFNLRVPKELKDNLRWRARSMESVIDDQDVIAFFRSACERDPLFFINAFCWTYDPRCTQSPKIPFILYDPLQSDAIRQIIMAIGDHDLLIEKSRDMGASWLCIVAFAWCYLYLPGFSGLFVSRVEEYVDKPGNPKSMFWKFDFILDNLPTWLRPVGYSVSLHRSKMHIENPENGAVIDGESTTGNVARGDRRTAILLDEFAAVEQGHRVLSSTRDATNCRLFNSTPAGTNNAFYDIRQTGVQRLRLHWSAHPVKSSGLYTTDDFCKLKHLDSVKHGPDFHPILDDKIRSPWYDRECERAINEQEIAQELDIDYLGSGFQYFNARAVGKAILEHTRPPLYVGELEYDDTTGEPIRFVEGSGGSLSLWSLLDGEYRPSLGHKFCAGADVSAGTGSSNSCLAGYDISTCEKVFEYVNPYLRPEQFAKQTVAIMKWFGNAFLIWESYGPGRQFGSRLEDLHYGNLYMRERREGISGKKSAIPGWCPTKEGKLILMGEYRSAVEKGECVNRSKLALEEALEYVFGADGSIEHSRSKSKTDPSGAKANHGDRCIADALAWKALRERVHAPAAETRVIPVGSLAWRNNRREQEHELQLVDGW